MSSATETLNKPENEEPTAKRVKLDGDEAAKLGDKSAENNNGTTASEIAQKSAVPTAADNNNGGTSKSTESASRSGTGAGNADQIPTKAANGNNKDLKASENDDEDDDDDRDQEAFGDPNIADRLREVEAIQLRIIQLNEQASEEILLVEQKFNQLRRPHFEKRNELLKDVPNFWLAALANHPLIASMIQSAEDEDCLHYMVNVDVEELDIKSGYNLKFYFAENPYIKNELIVRELRHLDNEEVVSETTTIEYKDTQEGKKLKEVVENSLAQYRRKVRDPSEMQCSFFAWLSQEQENGDEVAEIIKDQIWTSPVDFFLNNPEDYDDDSENSDEDEEDYDDEEAIENDLEPGIPDEDALAELQEIEGEEFDDEELDDDEDDDEDDDDEE